MINIGPDVVETGLRFHFDTLNERSYLGEPTTNFISGLTIDPHGSGLTLIDNPPNGRFSTGNAGANLNGKVFLNEVTNPNAGNNGGIRSTTAFNITGTQPYMWLSFYAYITQLYANVSLGGYITFKNGGGSEIGNSGWTFFVNGVQDNVWANNAANLNKWIKVEARAPVIEGSAGVTRWYVYADFLLSGKMYIARLQMEEKSHPTQYTATARSVSGSLLDLTGGAVINLSNSTYDSSAQIYFDGNSWALTSAPTLPTPNSTPLTLIAWCKPTGLSSWQTVLGTHGSFRQIGFSNTTFVYGGNGGGGNNFGYGAGGLSNNNWYMLAMTYDGGTTGYAYFNGIPNGSGNIGTNSSNNGVQVIGSYHSGGYEKFIGYIPMGLVYNRQLSAREILQIYNATKSRYIR